MSVANNIWTLQKAILSRGVQRHGSEVGAHTAQVALGSAPHKQMSPHTLVALTCVRTCQLACAV